MRQVIFRGESVEIFEPGDVIAVELCREGGYSDAEESIYSGGAWGERIGRVAEWIGPAPTAGTEVDRIPDIFFTTTDGPRDIQIMSAKPGKMGFPYRSARIISDAPALSSESDGGLAPVLGGGDA